ncbi:dihydrofolate reductase family protein [Kribbella sp. NPDC004536]|uniref:dihydrofolate reductase family protein n=1 Tax=Kribbella sp. NPDC004536 TaxID=3364106 RepID=UPI0036A85AE5
MGKIVISSNVTLDGVVQDPDGEEGFERGGWFHQFVGTKDLEAWVARETEELLGVEALLFGARSSEWFASRMLSAEARVSREWADQVKSLPKYVVSSSLDDPQWSNATVVGVKNLAELKRTVDGEILVYGSYQLVHTLIEQNLVDELRLVVFPVVLGTGRRIFDRGTKGLRLTETRRIGDGLVFYAYEFGQS